MNKKKGSPKRENAVKARTAKKKSNCIFIDENLKWWSVERKVGTTDDTQFEVIAKYPTNGFKDEYIAKYNQSAPCLLLFNGTGAISIIPIKKR